MAAVLPHVIPTVRFSNVLVSALAVTSSILIFFALALLVVCVLRGSGPRGRRLRQHQQQGRHLQVFPNALRRPWVVVGGPSGVGDGSGDDTRLEPMSPDMSASTAASRAAWRVRPPPADELSTRAHVAAAMDAFDYMSVDSDTSCPVCLEALDDQSVALRAPCTHVLHADCWTAWLVKDATRACPICRASVVAAAPSRGMPAP